MNIKEILAKLLKGEALTDAEKAFMAEYDPDKTADSKAAAARKAAEKERDTLRQKLIDLESQLEDAGNAGKTEVEQLKIQVAKMAKAVETATAAAAKAEGEKKALVRGTKLDRIMGGLKFVDGLDASLPRLALERAMAELKDEDLDNEDTIKPIVDGFRSKNKAILLDESGGGAGTPAKDGVKSASSGGKPIDKMTPDERRADMKKQGII